MTIVASNGSSSGGGSGVILDKEGHILTNHHVVYPRIFQRNITIEGAPERRHRTHRNRGGPGSAADLAV